MPTPKCFAISSAMLVASVAALGYAQPAHHDHEHGKLLEYKTPTNFSGAVREIRTRLHEIEDLMATKKLDQIHSQADVIRNVGDIVGQLALKADSGVPRESIKEVNKAGRELAAMFDTIDKVADAGDLVGTRKVFGDMKRLAEILQRHAPKEYVCPMRCEGDKVSMQPGKCPKCGMKLQDVLSHMDHSPKHGGVFFMAPDQTHHLEGTITDAYELRIYFYDEYTKPIPAEKFTARGAIRTNEAKTEQEITFSSGPKKEFLYAKPLAPVRFPVSVKVFVDFKDSQDPQVFDFDFDGPSKSSKTPGATDKAGLSENHPG